MKGLREKFQNKNGFTLIEMLIVVAIIAILIAIGIPLANSALERTRETADKANERAAIAEAVICYMDASTREEYFSTEGVAFYVIENDNGKLQPEVPETGKGYGQSKKNMGQYVKITMKNGEPIATWTKATDFSA